jgi:uncharacterized membrane protein
MNTNKFLIGGIIGGIVMFLLGWLVWGMLLTDFMQANAGTATGVMRPNDQMIFWAAILGNLCTGFAMSYVLIKAGVANAAGGAAIGAVVGLLFGASRDLVIYAVSNISNLQATLVNICAGTAVTAIVGAAVGWYLGMGRKVAVT